MKHSEIFEKFVAVSQTRPLNAEELDLINSHPQGLAGLIGLRFTHISADEIRSEVDVVPDHHQPWGVANGGLFCTITESTASVGSLILAGKPVVGVNNNTDFLKPVAEGTVTAVATPLYKGRRTQLWEVKISQGDVLLAASTLRTMVVQ
ncbi:PaaI family thioesterase [Corynebacterium sp. UMB6689]|uniref:PaaI family thioesterase n=1 Tax=Corynebacterium sp. UMB6689 TaxID=3046341 RepID=UPI0025517CBF|nr:PaaI family thioesterase [Corynebacterium sp. UMB6689]MDK6814128.1 PaaI family thioesterase [Corynebacterium sp. UMB6689]